MSGQDPNILDPTGLWLTITELAEAKGLGKAAISERVARFEEQGLLTTRPGKRKSKLVNLAEFDRVAGQVTDLARARGAETRRGADEGGESNSAAYSREQARNMAYRAELSRLELEERLGELVKVADLRPVIEAAAAAAVAVIEKLPKWADDMRAECARDEGAGLERLLKSIATGMRAEMAKAIGQAMPTGPLTARGDGDPVE